MRKIIPGFFFPGDGQSIFAVNNKKPPGFPLRVFYPATILFSESVDQFAVYGPAIVGTSARRVEDIAR